jgi:lipid II:glycine glycyltransferase (peptidoglycan interpeptide bridge formation enzyme)
VASLRSEWGQDLAQSGLPLHAADCIQPRSSQLIDLRPGIDAVVAAYDPELRRYAAQAAGSGLRAVVASTHDAPIALKEIMDAVAARTGIRKRAAAYYSNLIASLGAHLAIGTMTTATHLMGGATNEGLARRVPVLLQGEAIRRAVERGACEFDLWGLPTLGLATNKAKWGGTAYAYAGAFDLDLDRLRAPIIRAALRMRGFGA